MMLFSMDVVRARKGDCLMLHFGSKDDPHLVLIDGGPRGVYVPQLRPRIELIRRARELAEDESLFVDLVMVSHVDDDHIQGILELTRELIDAEMDNKPQLLQAAAMWHNSFDNIIGSDPDPLTALIQNQFGAASTEGEFPEDADLDTENHIDRKEVFASLSVLSSIRQGAQLRRDAERLGIEINPGFGIDPQFRERLIIADEQRKSINLGSGLEFVVIGPLRPDLDKLQAEHDEWLKDLEKQGKSADKALAAYMDKSIANLSSLVFLARVDGKTMLLTGDARGDKILEGLRLVGLLDPGQDSSLHVDLLKIPHHGSANNMEPAFFKQVTADHYVFSGNGEYGNPERESLEMLLEARGDAPYTMHFTYPIEEIDVEREKDWEKQQRRERSKGKPVRENWSNARHSLTGLFETHRNSAQKVRFVDEGEPHVIDLLDGVGF